MRKLHVVGLAFVLLFCSAWAEAAWNAAWPKRVKVKLDTTATGLPLQAGVDRVPLLVRLHTGNFPFLDAKPDGSDLRFIAADDKTPLKHHIEKFDGLNELALVWVQLPLLKPGAKDDHIWVYFGNAAAPAGDDAKGTYDATQALVYHFGEKEALPQDATANANHADKSTARVTASGLIGGSLAFDGKAELTVADKPSLNATPNGLTVSFWVKPQDGSDGSLYLQGAAGKGLVIEVKAGKLTLQSGPTRLQSTSALTPAAWQHVAVVVKDGLTLYVNGTPAGNAGGATAAAGAITIGRGFKGEIDELQVSSTARPADWIKVAAQSQGQDQKLVSYGASEGDTAGGGGEASYIKILLGAVTLDGWIVIAILGVMFIFSLWVMASKLRFLNRVSRDNKRFMQDFDKLINSIDPEQRMVDAALPADTDAVVEPTDGKARRKKGKGTSDGRQPSGYLQSQLYRLYLSGVTELQARFESYRKQGKPLTMTVQSLSAIRASVDAALVREIQRLNSQMVVLTISIAGGPFLGLLGTVVGVMITFAAIAAAGDVNVNAIAPGIAAALVATVAGLAVAIPALFAYNYLTGRIQSLVSDMQVFVDELSTRIAENHSV